MIEKISTKLKKVYLYQLRIKDNDPKKFKNAINNLFIEKKIFINKELAKQRIIDKYDVSKSILKFQDEFN